jgi:hypothetical protein
MSSTQRSLRRPAASTKARRNSSALRDCPLSADQISEHQQFIHCPDGHPNRTAHRPVIQLTPDNENVAARSGISIRRSAPLPAARIAPAHIMLSKGLSMGPPVPRSDMPATNGAAAPRSACSSYPRTVDKRPCHRSGQGTERREKWQRPQPHKSLFRVDVAVLGDYAVNS